LISFLFFQVVLWFLTVTVPPWPNLPQNTPTTTYVRKPGLFVGAQSVASFLFCPVCPPTPVYFFITRFPLDGLYPPSSLGDIELCSLPTLFAFFFYSSFPLFDTPSSLFGISPSLIFCSEFVPYPDLAESLLIANC